MTRISRSFTVYAALPMAGVALLTVASLVGCGRTSEARAKTAPTVSGAPLQVIETAPVVSHALNSTTNLPGELLPYETVAIYPKVTGFIQWIGVDRGSRVRKGQLLAKLVAPEMVSQQSEAQAKLQSAQSRQIEAAAKTAADEATYKRLQVAAATPGVISENELDIAHETAAADRARQQALQQAVDAAHATLKSVEQMAGYLRIVAPFDGVVTDRNVHPGALVGPGGSRTQTPMLDISQIRHLRLVVAVPEASVAYISEGAQVAFTVPSYPDETFHGTIARLANSIDEKTRTMPVEMDVDNSSDKLAPGMFPQVQWPERHREATLFVPTSSVVHSMEEVFVVRIRNGMTEWVPVKLGAISGQETEVFGSLAAGDQVALRGTEELRPGTSVEVKPAAAAQP